MKNRLNSVCCGGWIYILTVAVVGGGIFQKSAAQELERSLIAFSADRDGDRHDIFVMDADGNNLRNVTAHPAGDAMPRWSPDGRKILFRSSRWNENWNLYKMDSDGRNIDRLTDTNAPGGDYHGSWSPDGNRIVFTSSRGGNQDIFVMSAEGKDQRNLTNHPERDDEPAWSPDGKWIAFYSTREGLPQVYVMDMEGKNIRRVTADGGTYPSWSPNSRQLTFQHRFFGVLEDIYTINLDGSNLRNLTNHRAADRMPAWSPTGKEIAFISDRDGNEEIYVMDVDGGNVRRLTFHPAFDAYPDWFVPASLRSVYPRGKSLFSWAGLKSWLMRAQR